VFLPRFAGADPKFSSGQSLPRWIETQGRGIKTYE
jgi:hypothetical protein